MQDFVHAKSFLTLPQQREIITLVRQIQPGFYTPKTRWGKSMSLQMNCLGRHWSARDYKYHANRVDVDGLPCAPIPELLQSVAHRALLETKYLPLVELRPFDVCIVNHYIDPASKLGDHVDNSEGEAALDSGYPVVSLSIGASCVFRMGGLQRTDPYEKHVLDSGDLVIFGRSLRRAFHGVKKIMPDSKPPELAGELEGRLNFTFRVL